jgi:hypothetical protein
VSAVCTRDGKLYSFYFGPYRDGIAKIGQNPSPADIVSQDMARFRGDLEPLDLAELEHATRTIQPWDRGGCVRLSAAHFERLLGKTSRELCAVECAIDGYEDMSVEDRVFALKAVLPKEVVRKSTCVRNSERRDSCT